MKNDTVQEMPKGLFTEFLNKRVKVTYREGKVTKAFLGKMCSATKNHVKLKMGNEIIILHLDTVVKITKPPQVD